MKYVWVRVIEQKVNAINFKWSKSEKQTKECDSCDTHQDTE